MSNTFERVALWNQVCGKNSPTFGTPDYYDALRNQACRIAEELEELFEAINNCNILMCAELGTEVCIRYKGESKIVVVTQELIDHWNQEILDAGCDLDVVVAGVNFIAGHDYDGAITAVLDNNDVKYTYVRSEAESSLLKLGTRDHHIIEVPVSVSTETAESEANELGYTTKQVDGQLHVMVYSVHRKSDDKICKLLDHPKVDLSPFVFGNTF